MRLSQAIEGYILDRTAAGFSPHTLNGYDYIFKKRIAFTGDSELEDIGADDICRFFASLNQLSSQTRKKAWSDLRAFFSWASIEFDLRRPDTLPCPPAQNKPVTPFTEEEIKKMLKACERTAEGKVSRKPYGLPRKMKMPLDKLPI